MKCAARPKRDLPSTPYTRGTPPFTPPCPLPAHHDGFTRDGAEDASGIVAAADTAGTAVAEARMEDEPREARW